MSRPCSICAGQPVGAINAAIEEGRSLRSLAAEFGVSKDALARHAHHLDRYQPVLPARNGGTDPLDELVDHLRDRALSGDAALVREYRLGLAAQAATAHAAAPLHDLASEPEWIALRGRILDALAAFPEARLAVAEALGA